MAQVPMRGFERLPLVIGTTGHRDLRPQDIPALEAVVDIVFDRIKREYLGGRDTPMILLSSLAEGADRLVARVGLRHGVTLVVPLPLPADDYRRDFEPGLLPNAATEFDALVAQAAAAPVVPCAPNAKRSECYRAAGLFITRHSHLLIALWDGESGNAKIGGTAEIVAYFRSGVPLEVAGSARSSLDISNKGPIIHVVAPRANSSGDPSIRVEPWGDDARQLQSGGEWEVLAAILSLTTRFNRESAALDQFDAGAAARQKSLDYLFMDAAEAVMTSARNHAESAAQYWCAFYARADVLAQQWQRRFKRDWIWLFAIGFGSFLCFEVFAHAFHRVWLMALYAILFVVAAIILIHVRTHRHQERFLDYRALAEALRVGIFWKLMGSEHSSADAYPIKQHSELAWVKICLRSLELLDLIDHPPQEASVPEPERLDWLRAIWVDGQRHYFAKQGRRHKLWAEGLKYASIVLLALSPALAAFRIGLDYWGGLDAWSWATWENQPWWIFAIGVLPGLAAVSAGYSEQLAFDAQAHQYERMHALFARAHELLSDAVGKAAKADVGPALAHALYTELGIEAMQENAQWVALYRQRPIRLPRG